MQQQLLSAKNISKSFFGVTALKNISFDLNEGEILTFLGENGAGKSTLMNILTGVYSMDRGEVSLYGKPVNFRIPQDSINVGIGMVHQHFMLVDEFLHILFLHNS